MSGLAFAQHLGILIAKWDSTHAKPQIESGRKVLELISDSD